MKKCSTIPVMLIILGLIVVLVGGCGGGGSSSGPTTLTSNLSTNDHTLSTGEYCDGFRCSARTTGTATVTMSSSAVDSYLIAFDNTTHERLAENDDYTSGSPDAQVSFPVTRGQQILIIATSYHVGETGSYSVHFNETLGNVRLDNNALAVPQAARLQSKALQSKKSK